MSPLCLTKTKYYDKNRYQLKKRQCNHALPLSMAIDLQINGQAINNVLI